MGWLRNLINCGNPTRGWIASASPLLEVELDAWRFSGAVLGDPIEQLRHLGPSSRSRWYDPAKSLLYSRYGFQLYLDGKGRLDGVDISLVPEADGSPAFAGRWLLGGRGVAVTASHTPEQIEALLGPARRVQDGGCVSLCYTRPGSELWFEWEEDEQLTNVLLTQTP